MALPAFPIPSFEAFTWEPGVLGGTPLSADNFNEAQDALVNYFQQTLALYDEWVRQNYVS